ncbi:MAG: hypothetical protein ORN23_03985 [Chthoniobacterales bacterium]|nr:hypothetical protein [Chthoniobacterales bacterium]
MDPFNLSSLTLCNLFWNVLYLPLGLFSSPKKLLPLAFDLF